MRKLLLSFCLVIFCLVSFGQVYQEMPQYGYRANRMAFDSTLQIPTVCGVPTLKSVVSVSKKAAIAFDSCNNKLYKYNPKTLTWSEVSGGAGSNPQGLDSVLSVGNISIGKEMYILDTTYRGFSFYTQGNKFNTDYGSELYISSKGSTNNGIGLQSGFGNNFEYGKIKFYNGDDGDKTLQFPSLANGVNIINLPPFNYNGHSEGDTLATLYDIRNNLSIPNLQQVTDANSITTNNITIGDALYITNSSTNKTGNINVDGNGLSDNRIYDLPDSSGIFVLSINGEVADAKGSVTIPVGDKNGRFGNDTATIIMAKVHNDAGVILTNGKVVAFSSSGTSSDVPSVRLANNKGDSTSANTFGFVSGTIAINDTGWIILSGKIEKLNTSAYSNGDIIYLDSVSGNWVKTKPVAPYHMVYLGVVIKANAGNGSIFVKCQNGYELDEIHDVKINGKLNNQVLAYSDTQKVWKNKNIYSIVDTSATIATKTNVALKVNISDTAAMLSKYLRKSDTTAMLSPYFRKSDTSSLSNRIDSKNYAIGLGGTAITVNASTTYYFGTPAQTVTNSAAIRRIYIPVSGTLKGGQIYAKTTVATTTENWTLTLRLNNTSNTTFATVGNALTDKVFGTSSLNIAVVAGDYIEITTTTPAWVIAPGATFFYGTIFIQ